MYIDRCGRRHRIEGQGLFATLLVNRIRRLRLLHQANSFIRRTLRMPPVPYGGRCVENWKAQGGVALLTAASGAAATSTRYAPTPTPASGGE